MDKCVDGWSMNLWMNECYTNFAPYYINLCVKCVFNVQYQCMKHMNYEWMNFARFPLLSHEMLNLWYSISWTSNYHILLQLNTGFKGMWGAM